MIYDWFHNFSRQLLVNVFAYDYTGYGKSSGTASEANCYADIEAAYKHLTEVFKVSFLISVDACRVVQFLRMPLHRLAGPGAATPGCALRAIPWQRTDMLPSGEAWASRRDPGRYRAAESSTERLSGCVQLSLYASGGYVSKH